MLKLRPVTSRVMHLWQWYGMLRTQLFRLLRILQSDLGSYGMHSNSRPHPGCMARLLADAYIRNMDSCWCWRHHAAVQIPYHSSFSSTSGILYIWSTRSDNYWTWQTRQHSQRCSDAKGSIALSLSFVWKLIMRCVVSHLGNAIFSISIQEISHRKDTGRKTVRSKRVIWDSCA
jgi:hypothetical protein